MNTVYTPSRQLSQAQDYLHEMNVTTIRDADDMQVADTAMHRASAAALVSIAQSLEQIAHTSTATTNTQPQAAAVSMTSVDYLLGRLNIAAQRFNPSDYGLPMHDESTLNVMRREVDNWLSEVRS